MINLIIINNIIFILGFSRSGTTFLQSLISTQPNMVSIPETHFFDLVTHDVRNSDSIQKAELSNIYSQIKKFMNFEFSLSQKQSIERKIDEEGLSKKALFQQLVECYCDNNAIKLNSTNILVEKTPDHARVIDEIASTFSTSFFISIFRHPVFAIQSHREKLSLYGDSYEGLAFSWTNNVKRVLSFKKRYPDQIFSTRFEDFRLNYREKLKVWFKQMGLEFREENLDKYTEEAKNLILPYETWKLSNTQSNFVESQEQQYLKRMPLLKLLAIQNIMVNEMRVLGYTIYYPWLQKAYNIFLRIYRFVKRIENR